MDIDSPQKQIRGQIRTATQCAESFQKPTSSKFIYKAVDATAFWTDLNYHTKDDEEIPPNSYAVEQTEHEQNYPESEKNARRPQDVKIHRADSTETNA